MITTLLTAASILVSSAETADTLRNIDLEEVAVVSTPKETGKLRQQPMAVSLVGQEQMVSSHISNIKGASSIVPNFFMPDYGSRLTSAVYIRGVGSRINTPAVGLYVDNIPYADKSAFDFSFYDIERIDVLRGPQGTLYGRNAMGGIMKVHTRNPFAYQGTDVKLGYATGNHQRQVSLSHYHRPSDYFAFSISGYYEGNNGFFTNDYTGKKADGGNAGGGRFRGIYRPSDRWKFDLSANYDHTKEGAYPYYYSAEQENGYHELVGKISNNRESSYRRDMVNVGLNIENQHENWQMNAVTGYQFLDDRMFMDQDFLSADIYTLEQKQRIHTLTEELTFKSKRSDSWWEWVSGANAMYQSLHTEGPVVFYQDGLGFLENNINAVMPDIQNNEKMSMLQMMGFTGMGVNFRGDELLMDGTYETPTLNLALFHQSTFNITEHFSTIIGLRLDYEHLKMKYHSPAYVEYGFTMPNASNEKMAVNLQDLSSTLLYDGTLKNDNFRLLPKFALKYDFGKQSNVYASVAMGQRSGGYNLQMFSDLLQGALRVDMMNGIKEGVGNYLDYLVENNDNIPKQIPDPENSGSFIALPDFVRRVMNTSMPEFEVPTTDQVVYKPEYSWNYEVGTHLNLLDRRLMVDAAVFFLDTRNQQIARFAASGLGRMMVNAGHSQSYGAELAFRYSPVVHLLLTGSYGYTHATFKEFDSGNGNDYSGNFVPFVPQHTVCFDASYSWNIAKTWAKAVTLGANLTGNGAIYWNESNNNSENFYGLLNLRALFEMKHVDVQLWAKNVTNNAYNTFYFESVNRGFEQHNKPRQFGVDIMLHF